MTVRELIARLNSFSPDMTVVVDGYEAGVDILLEAKTARVRFEERMEHWRGQYDLVESGDAELPTDMMAVYLPRPR